MKTGSKNLKLICLSLVFILILGVYAASRGTIGMVGTSSPSVQPMSVVSCTICTDRQSSSKAEVFGDAFFSGYSTYATMQTFLQYKSGDTWKKVTTCSPTSYVNTDYDTPVIVSGGIYKQLSSSKIYRGAVTVSHKLDGITYTNNYRSSSF